MTARASAAAAKFVFEVTKLLPISERFG